MNLRAPVDNGPKGMDAFLVGEQQAGEVNHQRSLDGSTHFLKLSHRGAGQVAGNVDKVLLAKADMVNSNTHDAYTVAKGMPPVGEEPNKSIGY